MSAEFPFERLKLPRPTISGHPLEGRIWSRNMDQIAHALWMDPPNGQQAMILALEEMRRPGPEGDRADVYRLLDLATKGK